MKSARIIVAGIGNIFLGDDAFGVEVARQLGSQDLPHEVSVEDFGIRSYDLAYAIAGESEAVILVDASPRGDAPGTLYLIEPDISCLDASEVVVNGHTLNPVTVLLMAQQMDPVCCRRGRIYVVGCEPEVLDSEDGSMELSPAVKAAVPGAIRMIRSLIARLLSQKQTNRTNLELVHHNGGNSYGTLA